MKLQRPQSRTSISRPALVLILWVGFIFGTSCTVVKPHEFFAMVQKYANFDEASMARFQVFWGVSWFAIVKGWHFLEFALLLFFCVGLLRFIWQSTSPRLIGVSMLLCIIFAISDEWHQTFVPERFGTVTDVLIDSLGVCVAGAFLLWKQRTYNDKTIDNLTSSSR